MEDLERELALESEMLELGGSKLWAAVLEAREKNEESQTKYSRRIMAGDGQAPGALELFGRAVREFLVDAKRRPGKRHSVVAVLEQVASPEVVAFIGLQVVLNGIIKQKALVNTAVVVGQALEDELRFTHFETVNPAFWETLRKDLEKREHNLHRRRMILLHEMVKGASKQEALQWKSWSKEEKLCVGVKVIDLLEKSTGLVKTFKVRDRKKLVTKIAATTDTLAWINDFMVNGGVLEPSYLPTIIPPRRWKTPKGGGYWLKTLRPLPLVKVRGERGLNYLNELAQCPKQMRQVYAAVNAVQSTAWKINQPVLEVMQQAATSGLEIGKAPMMLPKAKTKEDRERIKAELDAKMPLPVKPFDIATNEVARVAWRREAAKVHAARVKQASRSLQHHQLLHLAKRFKDEHAIYFPMQLDFRGRMYAVPSNLNPQGSDPAKALLTFAKGKKLGESGLRWLLIHAANMWGEDKVSLDAREQWSLDNMVMIRNSATLPFEHREWMQADKPWQFLAACYELSEAYNMAEPTDYFSHLPVTVDGTCNGLQHFSAMLLDEDGARAVNLMPADEPQDIYQRVADRVRSRLEKVVRDTGEGHEMAEQWLRWGFDRKSTKRAVMIVPYSGTQYAAKEYTVDYIQARKDCPFDDPFKPAYFFATHVWSAIAETIVSAKKVMDWLRKTGRAVTAGHMAVVWTTPVGLPVRQDYRDMQQYRVTTRIGRGITFMPVLLKETDRFDKKAMEQGISPNFVHSLDAACLMLTVNRAKDEGIDSFAMVHDSYGVLAADMDMLYHGLRQAFVDIYQTDVMASFIESATSGLTEEQRKGIPPMPKKGTFQLELVKQSKYFFA